MKRFPILLAGVAVAALASPGVAAAQDEPRMPGSLPDNPTRGARQALEQVSTHRLFTDPNYARQILAHLATVRPLAKDDPEEMRRLDRIGMFAQAALGRVGEAWELAQRLIATAPDRAESYAQATYVAIALDRPLLAVATIEAASRSLASQTGRREFRKNVGDELMRNLRVLLARDGDDEARHRLAEALLTLEWPGPDERARMDWLRVTAIDGRLKKGDVPGARSLAAAIATPAPLIQMLVARKYDPLFPEEEDRVIAIRLALARRDTETADRLAAGPADADRLLDRAKFLRGVGRSADAVALLEPHIADMKAVERGGEDAFWLVNEAAYALLELGRRDEAVARMQKLIELGPDRYPPLINMAINTAEILNSAGRFKEAAALAARLAAEQTKYATKYGEMWMWSNAACALALDGDSAAAAPWLRKVEAGSKDNEAAHMRALLCAGDLDGAERLLIRRLEGDNAADVLVALQDYELGGYDSPATRRLVDRLHAVRARPAVQAAIARTGRVIRLPLARTYWGEF